MSTIAGMKLVASKKSRSLSPIQLRRNKLAAKLNEQIELAQAQKEGRPYAPKRIKTLVNAERYITEELKEYETKSILQ